MHSKRAFMFHSRLMPYAAGYPFVCLHFVRGMLMHKEIIALLTDMEIHSGQDLADRLGVSRTAVWKVIKKLKALGVPLEVHKGLGYRLLAQTRLLDREKITLLLASKMDLEKEYSLHVMDSVDSTSMHASSLVRSKADRSYAVIAEAQTAGKGRRGREWVSPFGVNLYLTITQAYEGGVGSIEGLSLAAGVVVRDVLERAGVCGIGLKWPNDLLVAGKKLCGVLIEIVGDPTGEFQVVVGVGVNVNMTHIRGIDQPWTSVANEMGGQSCDRSVLAAEVLIALSELLKGYPDRGFGFYRPRWSELDAFVGREVFVTAGDRVSAGVAKGVSLTGGLLLDVDGECIEINGGEVSLRIK
jgi:BirA family biotin operon repressor/biotin-[acetyl-CoA-carboxylase] ligase